jgi:hypothetical protein
MEGMHVACDILGGPHAFACILVLLSILGDSSWRVHMLKVSSFLFLEIVVEGTLAETSMFYFGV